MRSTEWNRVCALQVVQSSDHGLPTQFRSFISYSQRFYSINNKSTYTYVGIAAIKQSYYG